MDSQATYRPATGPILVTGGSGFIGANFILDWLAGGGDTVVNLDILSYAGNPENLAAVSQDRRYRFVQGDIADATLVGALLAEVRPRAIVHFAAESHVDRSISGPAAFIETNVNGTFQLLEAARQYWTGLGAGERDGFRFLHVSTDEVFGSLAADDPPFTESSVYAPNSPYSASKAASDHLVRAYHHTYGLPVLTTHCSNNYGPFQFPEKLIPVMIQSALAGRRLPVYGDGMQVRDWLHVSDHCSALRRVLESGTPGDCYNIGGWNEKANVEVVGAICAALDNLSPRMDGRSYAELIEYVQDRPGHDRRYAINASHIESRLGWRPAFQFDDGLLQTVRWYLDHQGWVARVMDGSYRRAAAAGGA